MTNPLVVFFAGGSKGPNVRADGKGSYLKRGHYIRDINGKLHGPFTTRRKALYAKLDDTTLAS